MTTIYQNLQSTEAFNNLESAYMAWRNYPDDPFESGLCDLFSDILYDLHAINAPPSIGALQNYTFEKFILFCRDVITSERKLSETNNQALAEILLTKGWWIRLVDVGEDYLLASFLLMAANKEDNIHLVTASINAASDWANITFPEINKTHVETMARFLYGEAWSILYSDELDSGFGAIYNLLEKVQPPMIIPDFNITSTYLPDIVVPTDIG